MHLHFLQSLQTQVFKKKIKPCDSIGCFIQYFHQSHQRKSLVFQPSWASFFLYGIGIIKQTPAATTSIWHCDQTLRIKTEGQKLRSKSRRE